MSPATENVRRAITGRTVYREIRLFKDILFFFSQYEIQDIMREHKATFNVLQYGLGTLSMPVDWLRPFCNLVLNYNSRKSSYLTALPEQRISISYIYKKVSTDIESEADK